MTKQVEGWNIGSMYHTDAEGRKVAQVTNLGVPSDNFWHVESFDPATGHLIDNNYCYNYQEAVELANVFLSRWTANAE